MTASIRYGRRMIEVEVTGPEPRVLQARREASDPVGLALAAPIGSPPLQELVGPGQRVAVVTSDVTRPCPSAVLLSKVVDVMVDAGVREEDIQVVFGLGMHRPHTSEEQRRLVGPILDRVACVDSDPTRTVRVGTTSRGTPIDIFEPVAHADVRIALGCVEPHYFAGYSGGHKALVPGVCSEATIAANHSMMVAAEARAGVLSGNPVREDIDEGGSLAGTDFIVNVVLDADENIVAAAAGDPIEAHRWACRVVDHQSRVAIEQPADVVLVGAGGYPKDINLYQAQKALSTAAQIVREGGTIVWAAACSEGFGNAVFEEWLVGSSAVDILDRFRQGFVLGGHKAAAIAKVLTRATVILVSELPPEVVRTCGLVPRASVQTALLEAVEAAATEARVVVLPEGGSVLATVDEAENE